MAFDPTFDGKFIHKSPTESLRDGPVNRVPYIIGCNDSEGHGMLTLIARTPHYETGMDEDSAKVFISNFLPRMSVSIPIEVAESCVKTHERTAAIFQKSMHRPI